MTFPVGSRFYDWQYQSEPARLNGQRIYHAPGKVPDGSSGKSTTHLTFVRAGRPRRPRCPKVEVEVKMTDAPVLVTERH